MLNRTSPIWVSLFALLILRERISKVQIPVILLCLAGAVAAMRPSFDSNTLPLVLALLTAVSSGLALYHDCLLPRPGESHDRDLPLLPVQYHCRRSFDDSQFCGPHPRDLMMLILIGIFGAGGQIGLTYAYQKGPSGGSEYL